MRKIPNFLLILALAVSSLLTVSGSSAADLAQGGPPPSRPTTNTIFLPLVIKAPNYYSVTGKVFKDDGSPLPGATVADNFGHETLTRSDGAYSLQVLGGENAVTVSKDNTVFTPSVIDLDVKASLSGQNFTACADKIVNGGFEFGKPYLWWNLLEDDFPAARVESPTFQVYSGGFSLMTGIPYDIGAPKPNIVSYSEAWTPEIFIPADVTDALLSMYIWPATSETTAAPSPADLPDADEFYAPEFASSPLGVDFQFVRIDEYNQYHNLIGSTWVRAIKENTRAWTNITFDLRAFAGSRIKVVIGTFNDGTDGYTYQFTDDVTFTLCSPTIPPPPPPPPPTPVPTPVPPPTTTLCTPATQQWLTNNDFETTGGWYRPATAYTAGYSTLFPYSPVRSMRTGIYYPAQNRYSYSDFRRGVTIPFGTTAAYVDFWALRITGETPLAADSPELADMDRYVVDGKLQLSPDEGDLQYLLLLDSYLTIRYWPSNWRERTTANWTHFIFPIPATFFGQTIYLQWGTYNNGWGGVTSMFIDNAFFYTCP